MCQTTVNLTPCCTKHTSRSGTKVARLDICRSIISLSKVAHQMWHNHPFSQKNARQQRKQWGWGLEATRKGRGSWTKFEKGGGG